jgi:hypothetical protein
VLTTIHLGSGRLHVQSLPIFSRTDHGEAFDVDGSWSAVGDQMHLVAPTLKPGNRLRSLIVTPFDSKTAFRRS